VTLQAVLFDMDGTLVDSEKTWQIALSDLAASHGGTLSDSARRALLGATTADSMRIVYDDLRQPWQDHEAGGRWLEARVMELFGLGLEWQPGARELLLAVRAAGLKTALVTATARHITEVMLDTLGRDNFDAVVTQDDVVNGKPDPEPYRHAAGLLGVPIGACVAIEDSVAGATSAIAAGCAVLAVPSEMDLPDSLGAATVSSLTGVGPDDLRKLAADYANGAAAR
jgi:HAD superfamily hydrolase (TIGR01509 family)